MTTAIFQGIYNTATKQYLTNEVDASAIKQIDADGILVGVIHDQEGKQELTFQCFGDGLIGTFPASWNISDEYSDAENVEDLITKSGETFRVDPDFFDSCPYKHGYPVNA